MKQPTIQRLLQAAVLVMGLCSLFVTTTSADDTTNNTPAFNVADYVAMDLAVRQLTVDGVKDRVVLLELDENKKAHMAHDANNRQQVDAIYQQYGMTSSKAVVLASQHAEAIAQWLANHPDQQAEYDRLAHELEQLSQQIQTLVNQP